MVDRHAFRAAAGLGRPSVSAAPAWLSSLPSQQFEIRTNFICRTPCNTAFRFHPRPLPGAIPKPDRSCVTRTGHIACQRQAPRVGLTSRVGCSYYVPHTKAHAVGHRGSGIRWRTSWAPVVARPGTGDAGSDELSCLRPPDVVNFLYMGLFHGIADCVRNIILCVRLFCTNRCSTAVFSLSSRRKSGPINAGSWNMGPAFAGTTCQGGAEG